MLGYSAHLHPKITWQREHSVLVLWNKWMSFFPFFNKVCNPALHFAQHFQELNCFVLEFWSLSVTTWCNLGSQLLFLLLFEKDFLRKLTRMRNLVFHRLSSRHLQGFEHLCALSSGELKTHWSQRDAGEKTLTSIGSSPQPIECLESEVRSDLRCRQTTTRQLAAASWAHLCLCLQPV